MRLEVTLPDSVFADAQRAAIELGVSVDRFIAESVAIRLDDSEQGPFTAESVEEIRAAQVEARSGRNLTVDQYRVQAEQRRKAWHANHVG